jgi:hypothetical protein
MENAKNLFFLIKKTKQIPQKDGCQMVNVDQIPLELLHTY